MADDRAKEFVDALAMLGRGELAMLKRNAGETISSARGVTGLFYRILPDGVAGGWNEEIYFLAATLYGINCKIPHLGDFGTTMAGIRGKSNLANLDRRMAVLLDSDFNLINGKPGGGEMAFRLRQLVKLAASKGVGVDWPQLLKDLANWSHPGRRTRKRWAMSYYGKGNRPEPTGAKTEEV